MVDICSSLPLRSSEVVRFLFGVFGKSSDALCGFALFIHALRHLLFDAVATFSLERSYMSSPYCDSRIQPIRRATREVAVGSVVLRKSSGSHPVDDHYQYT